MDGWMDGWMDAQGEWIDAFTRDQSQPKKNNKKVPGVKLKWEG